MVFLQQTPCTSATHPPGVYLLPPEMRKMEMPVFGKLSGNLVVSCFHSIQIGTLPEIFFLEQAFRRINMRRMSYTSNKKDAIKWQRAVQQEELMNKRPLAAASSLWKCSRPGSSLSGTWALMVALCGLLFYLPPAQAQEGQQKNPYQSELSQLHAMFAQTLPDWKGHDASISGLHLSRTTT